MSFLYRPALLCLFLVAFSCQPNISEESDVPQVRLECKAKDASSATPQYAVYAIVGYNKVKIANYIACDSIAPKQYSRFNIPEAALAAVGGSTGGAANYMYAIEEEDKIYFYDAHTSSSLLKPSDEPITYHKVGVYANDKFDLQLPPSRQEIVGTYALSKEEGSRILFVGMSNDKLVAEYFQSDGILPPVNQLNLYMSAMEPDSLTDFKLDPATMAFTSEKGRGKFVRSSGGGLDVVLYLEKEEVVLEKILNADYSIPVE